MLLTVSKRLEFSASRRLNVPQWSEEENLAAFGPESAARYGTGRNYVAYFILSGDPSPANGMLINISEIKKRALHVVSANYDHKFLNEDHEVFAQEVPTAENIARQLFVETSPRFADLSANLAAVHLIESPDRSATFYSSGMQKRTTGSTSLPRAGRCRRILVNWKTKNCLVFRLAPRSQLSRSADVSG